MTSDRIKRRWFLGVSAATTLPLGVGLRPSAHAAGDKGGEVLWMREYGKGWEPKF